ncbi:MAG: cobalamin B12-binding domain-containing protein [Acidimicrobiia bacterium]
MDNPPIRVLIAKPGLDGHDRGAKVVVKALRDAGMEVIYTGRHQKVASITRIASHEDVDVVGLSVLSGAHEEYCRRVHEALREAGLQDVILVVGGTISEQSWPVLTELGFLIYPTGAVLTDIVTGITEAVATRTARTYDSGH